MRYFTFSFPPMKIVLQRSRILSGAPFMTSKWRGSLGSSLSWIETWYLLVELKGISQAFLLRFLIDKTSPRASSIHLSKAASDASPATSFFRIGTPSWPPLNSARLQRVAILARALNPGLVRSEDKDIIIMNSTQNGRKVISELPLLRTILNSGLVFGGVSFNDLVIEPHVGDSHPVLCQGSGLIRADGGRRSECLYGLQILDQAILGSHSLGSQSQTYCYSGQ